MDPLTLYEKKKQKLQQEFSSILKKQTGIALGKSTSNLFRYRNQKGTKKIDVKIGIELGDPFQEVLAFEPPNFLGRQLKASQKNKERLKRIYEANSPIIQFGFESPREGRGTAFFVDRKYFSEDATGPRLKDKGFNFVTHKSGDVYYLGHFQAKPVRIYFVKDLLEFFDRYCMTLGITGMRG